jgi:hypothetical protein
MCFGRIFFIYTEINIYYFIFNLPSCQFFGNTLVFYLIHRII